MAGTMSEADLVDDLKASIQDAAKIFTAAADGDLKRHLKAAALDFARKRPRTLVGTLTLVADQAQYDAPVDLAAFKSHLWGIAPLHRAQPWEKTWPGRIPDVRIIEASNPGTRKLQLDPPPTSGQISLLGAEFRFYYYAAHVIDTETTKTTVAAADRGLLLLRAQAEAMKEMAMRNLMKPVMVREGMSSVPRNGTPAFLYRTLMDEFTEAA
jgi:hypothetical protein